MEVPTRRRDRGASLVEFAFILPLFVVLIFGMITGGMVLSQQNSVKNAVREASRFAAVGTTGSTDAELVAYLDDVIRQVINASTGDLGGSVASAVNGRAICVAFTKDGSTYKARQIAPDATAITDHVGSCYGDGLGSQPRTQVLAQRRAEISAIFFDVPIDLESKSVSRYER